MQNEIRSSAEERILGRLTRIFSSFTAESEESEAVCRGRRSDRRSVSPWSNGGGCLDIGSAGNLLGGGEEGREEGRGRVFAKEEEGGEEAETRIDMRPMGEREKGKGEGTVGAREGSGANEEERGWRKREREKELVSKEERRGWNAELEVGGARECGGREGSWKGRGGKAAASTE